MDQAAHRTHLNTVLAAAQAAIERMHTDLKTIKQANTKINTFVREQLDKDPDWRPEELWQDIEKLERCLSLAEYSIERAEEIHQDLKQFAATEPTSRLARWRQRRQLAITAAQLHKEAHYVEIDKRSARDQAGWWFHEFE